ncbi:aminotransferase class I/II-fold pyridoxal phosphate-dependent enzyme [candidate division KSB1 bacterium]|nr:aminotransferase class I/II-fold pyridoxal phosphate-dependent enzyme [candidate division KSB1 bacterium]
MLSLSQRVTRISESPTVALTGILADLKKQGKDVIGLGAGEPDFDTPPHIKTAAIESINDGFTKYTPAEGTLELKQAITDYINNTFKVGYDTSQVIVTCGAKHAVFQAIMAVCDPGDEVLLPSPYWVSYPEMIRLADARIRVVPTNLTSHLKVSADQLDEFITDKTKLFILNSPSNPSGAVYSEKELDDLVSVLKQKGIWVLSDEIYDQIVFDGLAFKSMVEYDSIREQLIYVNGVSKSFAMTGWRIGYLAAPPQVAKAIKKYQGHSTSNPSSISQKAALAAYRHSLDFVDEMLHAFTQRRDYVQNRLDEIAGVKSLKPQGAFYAFPNIAPFKTSKFKDSIQLCEYLLKEYGVAIVPGSGFGMDDHVRLSFATSMTNLEKALDRLTKGLLSLA